jgi:hypothetical protein
MYARRTGGRLRELAAQIEVLARRGAHLDPIALSDGRDRTPSSGS